MTTSELKARVTIESSAVCVALALAALAVWGLAAGAGVAAAGALTIANFRWLARGAAMAAGGSRERRLAVWMLSAAGRFTGLLAAFAALFASGWVHPVAVVAGLTVLPCAVVARGLYAARSDRER
jgi:ATP synthase I chain